MNSKLLNLPVIDHTFSLTYASLNAARLHKPDIYTQAEHALQTGYKLLPQI